MAAKIKSKLTQRLDEISPMTIQNQLRNNHKSLNEYPEKSEKKIEFSNLVVEVGDGTISMKSLNNTQEKRKKFSSSKEISEKKQGFETSPPSRPLGRLNDFQKTAKTLRAIRENNRTTSNDKNCKEKEFSKSRNEKCKKSSKSKILKYEIKPVKSKKLLEETQSPIFHNPKKSFTETCQLKTAKSEGNKLKFIEKHKLKSAKIITQNYFLQNIPKKSQNEHLSSMENTQKPRVLKSLLKPSKNLEISLNSSQSESESGCWIDLNIEEYKGKTSDFVGEFLEKINTQQKQLKNQVKCSLDSRVSVEHSTSNFSQSTEIPPAGKTTSKPPVNKNESRRRSQAEGFSLKEHPVKLQECKKPSKSCREETIKK